MPTTENGNVCGRYADPNHTANYITWQCDMVVNAVGRQSAFRHLSSDMEPVKQSIRLLYIDSV